MKFSKTGNSTQLLNDNTQGTLWSNFTPFGIWAFSIGTSIGWGSFIVTCSAYLQKAGILGTVFGLLIGMAVILVTTRNLQYMINKSPDAGGIYTFEKRIDELVKIVSEHNATAVDSGGIVIACGMAKYDNEPCVAPVFEQADQKMYENKNTLKKG